MSDENESTITEASNIVRRYDTFSKDPENVARAKAWIGVIGERFTEGSNATQVLRGPFVFYRGERQNGMEQVDFWGFTFNGIHKMKLGVFWIDVEVTKEENPAYKMGIRFGKNPETQAEKKSGLVDTEFPSAGDLVQAMRAADYAYTQLHTRQDLGTNKDAIEASNIIDNQGR